MKMKLILSLSILLLAGCASKPKQFVALPESIQPHIKSTDAYLAHCPRKIDFDIKNSNVSSYTGGGLIFGLIDAAIESNRKSNGEEALCEVQKELKNIDVQGQLYADLIPILKNTAWLNLQNIHHIKDLSDKKYKEICCNKTTDAVLVNQFVYKLSPDFKTLKGTLYITLYPTSSTLKTMIKTKDPTKTPIFKTNISSSYALENATDDIKLNGKLWSQNNAIYLKKAFTSLIKKLMIDLKNTLRYPNHLPENL